MASDPFFCEDLRTLAAESFELAIRHCRSCNEMHAVWPYVRLTRGGSDDASQIAAMLNEFAVGGRRGLLIAGAADTGLLALAANATRDARFAVLDRCQVPLELCRRQARSWSMSVETVHQDLASLDLQEEFQVILVHGTLPHLACEHHTDVLARLRRALCPSGRLVLLFYAARQDWEITSGSDRADWILARLDRMAVPLPEGRDEFHARLCTYARHHERCIQAFSDPELVLGRLIEAGFAVDRLVEVGIKFSNVGKAHALRHSQRKFIAVAEPNAGC